MSIRFPYLLAIGITAGIGVWMNSGTVVEGGKGKIDANETANAQKTAQNASTKKAKDELVGKPFRVLVHTFKAKQRNATFEMRGRSEADKRVMVRAETSGLLIRRPISEGQKVKIGDVLCELDKGARSAQLAQARAQLAQAEFDLKAQSKLQKKGFSSVSRVAALTAGRDAAKAQVEAASVELKRTTIKAPLSGVINTPLAEIGTRLGAGDVCAEIVNSDPMLVVGQVSERNIKALKVGMTATVSLVTGETVKGTIRYIASTSQAATRTFRVEIAIANKDGALRDGVTATATIPLPPRPGHLISPAFLTLADNGTIGVMAIIDKKTKFMPVTILNTGKNGMWVGGLPDSLTIITRGQEYVTEGQTVPTVEHKLSAEVAQ